jgi:putative membrane protein
MEVQMSSPAHPPDSNELAMDRTWLAHERTLMAWVRTATSMISFGFTIYKFFQFESEKAGLARHGIFSPRDFALVMVGIGLVSLLMATISHRREVSNIKSALHGRRSQAEVLALLVSLFGFAVFFSTLLRG